MQSFELIKWLPNVITVGLVRLRDALLEGCWLYESRGHAVTRPTCSDRVTRHLNYLVTQLRLAR